MTKDDFRVFIILLIPFIPEKPDVCRFYANRDRFTWVTVRDDKSDWIPGSRFTRPGMTKGDASPPTNPFYPLHPC